MVNLKLPGAGKPLACEENMLKEDLYMTMARKIKEWGLEGPAILILKIAKPITPIMSHGLIFMEPFVGPGKLKPFVTLLNEPERLLAFIEGENNE